MEEVMNRPENVLVYLPTSDLLPHPENPRKNIGDVSELAGSIKENGILQNLTVVPSEQVFDDVPGKHVVIIGHRRLAAAQEAGLEKVPCAVVNMTQDQQFKTMMIENMQRVDLTPIEQADGFQMMLDFGMTKDQITEQTGFSRTTIDHRLKMRELDRKKFTESQERGGTISDYIALEQIEDPKEKNKVLGYIGTADFRNTLQRALDEQKRKKELKKIHEYVISLGLKKMTKEQENEKFYSQKWERVESFVRTLAEAKKIKLTPGVQYFFCDNYSGIDVYRKPEKKPVEKRPQEEIDLEKWEKEGKDKLKEIMERHKQLRMDFVKELTEGGLIRSKKFTEVMKYAAMTVNPSAYSLYGMNSYSYKEKTFYEAMGVKSFYGPEDEKEKNETRKLIENNFVKSLAAVVYAKMEDQAEFFRFGYEKIFVPVVQIEGLMYAYLEALGYVTSTEEKDMISGAIVKELNDRRPGKK